MRVGQDLVVGPHQGVRNHTGPLNVGRLEYEHAPVLCICRGVGRWLPRPGPRLPYAARSSVPTLEPSPGRAGFPGNADAGKAEPATPESIATSNVAPTIATVAMAIRFTPRPFPGCPACAKLAAPAL